MDGLRAEADALQAVTDATAAQEVAAKALQVAQAPDEALIKGSPTWRRLRSRRCACLAYLRGGR
jgi:hypothetical protein